jgi:hypothetical protein
MLSIVRCCLILQVADDQSYDVVDLFDGKTGKWSTARLSVARYGLAATSLPSQGLALFAGGQGVLCLSCVVGFFNK